MKRNVEFKERNYLFDNQYSLYIFITCNLQNCCTNLLKITLKIVNIFVSKNEASKNHIILLTKIQQLIKLNQKEFISKKLDYSIQQILPEEWMHNFKL